jgi:hypothetical protein
LSVGALLHLEAFRLQEAFQVSEHFFFVDLFHIGPNFCIHDSRRMPRRQLQEKRYQSQQIAIPWFFHRRHEQPHHAPNAIMAQLKFSSRLSILPRVQAARAGVEDDVRLVRVAGNCPVGPADNHRRLPLFGVLTVDDS